MNHVIAFIDQDTCKVYKHESLAPRGSIVFKSPEELARALTIAQADDLRRKLLGATVEMSPSREVAAIRLWHVLSIGVDNLNVSWGDLRLIRPKDGFGNHKFSDSKQIELIQLIWVEGTDRLIDAFYKKLAKQEKIVLNILIEDGRGLWTGDQIERLMIDNSDRFVSKQPILKLWYYYRPQLCLKKFLKRVSFADFAASSEFSEIDLANKESMES